MSDDFEPRPELARPRGMRLSATLLVMAWLCWIISGAFGIFQWVNSAMFYDDEVALIPIGAAFFSGLVAGAILYGLSNCLLVLAEIGQSFRTSATPEASEPPDSGH